MTLHLTEPQRSLLLELLEIAHREKLHELHRTDSLGYKKILRARIETIEEVSTLLLPTEQTVGS